MIGQVGTSVRSDNRGILIFTADFRSYDLNTAVSVARLSLGEM